MKNVILRDSALQESITEKLQLTVILPGRKHNYFTWNKLLKPALKHKNSPPLSNLGGMRWYFMYLDRSFLHIKANGFQKYYWYLTVKIQCM